jgi:hypothetical protein
VQLHLPLGLLAAGLVLSTGCSDNTVSGGLPQACMTFVPAAAATCVGKQVLAQGSAASTCGLVQVEFRLNEAVTDLYGAKLTITDVDQGYDVIAVSATGSILESGGAQVLALEQDDASGDTTVVTVTRQGEPAGVSAVAGDLLLTVTFTVDLNFIFGTHANVNLSDTSLFTLASGATPPPVEAPALFCSGRLDID